MAFAIVTDSSSNLTEEVIDQFDLHILPLTFMVDGEEHHSYLKGQKTDLKQFYTMMREGKVITTSLPNLKNSRELLEGLLASGQDVLYIGFSSGLSGTYQAIDLLLAELADAYPDRTVLSVDTLAASIGEGLLVWYAAKMREEGASITEVRDWLEANKLHLAHWFTVDDLMFLFRGGRVSRTSAWAGTLLNIKPVMHVDDEGHLIPLEKVRGRKKVAEGARRPHGADGHGAGGRPDGVHHPRRLHRGRRVRGRPRARALRRHRHSHQLRGSGHRCPFGPRHHGPVLPGQ